MPTPPDPLASAAGIATATTNLASNLIQQGRRADVEAQLMALNAAARDAATSASANDVDAQYALSLLRLRQRAVQQALEATPMPPAPPPPPADRTALYLGAGALALGAVVWWSMRATRKTGR